ncbi:branched-chain amino acid ABC transporter substrate-binding protein [Gordonia desulfuricans]|uniref:Branched-chain amino acid ABC transporter substrate-binding protein n=1 Tax=Gordonia desulfuricans TaxID=89051 RepID=A0A7K3LSS3_9ACTN|nr:branched-chain amino acid ABC transporter substrate-binding protein [Gordonia desulfuricans]NDK91289.1 branched-chain amino acid ABC transporter substrate-binding protein [Gordonia desulfuricans]
MRRRMTTAAIAVTLTGALALSACSSKTTESESTLSITPLSQIDVQGNEVAAQNQQAPLDPGAALNATCPESTIAFAGAETGADSNLGLNILRGAKLAVDKFNKANPNCKIVLKDFDTEGDPQKATGVATQIVNDSSIIGLLGPAFSGETKATGGTFNQAGLVSVTASATNPTLTEQGWKTFFRGLANDAVQGPAIAKYLTGKMGKKKVCVVKDDTDYGIGLAKTVTEGLGTAADSACAGDVKKGQTDFSAVVSSVTNANPDAVFYSGYYAEAAAFAKQLNEKNSDILFVSGDGANDQKLIDLAGSSVKGAVLSCPCGPAQGEFASEFQSFNNAAPGVYSVEAYDLTTILMKGIAEGNTTRPKLLDFVRNYNGTGLARNYQWTPTGELTSSLIWAYEVK